MSKKCCGIIYNENEKFCTMCGKSLKELPEYVENAEAAATKAPEAKPAPAEAKAPEAKPAPAEDNKPKAKSAEEKTEQKPEQPVVLSIEEIDKIAASVEAGQPKEAEAEEPEVKEEEPTEPASDKEETKEKPEDKDKTKEADSQEEEEDDEEDEDDGTASPGLKFFGTLMILIMLASILAVGLAIYFVVLNPFYRNHDINNPVVYEEMSTDTDVNNIATRPALVEVSLDQGTATDAEDELATASDATDTDASDTDSSEAME